MIELWNNGEIVASAADINVATILEASDLFSFGGIGLLYFNSVTLTPVVAFEHIAGTALSKFLDHCTMTTAAAPVSVPGLRYVHGESEVMKGTPRVTSVLLARTDTIAAEYQIEDPHWAPIAPEIWHRFQGLRAAKHI